MAAPADQLPAACPYCGGAQLRDQTYDHAEGCTWRWGPADEMAFRMKEIERLHLTGRARQNLLRRGLYPEAVT